MVKNWNLEEKIDNQNFGGKKLKKTYFWPSNNFNLEPFVDDSCIYNNGNDATTFILFTTIYLLLLLFNFIIIYQLLILLKLYDFYFIFYSNF